MVELINVTLLTDKYLSFLLLYLLLPCSLVFVWLGWQDSNLRMPGSKPGALPLGDSPIYIVQPLSKLPLLLNTYACSAGLLRASCPTPFGPSAKVADVQNCSRQFCRTYACQDQNLVPYRLATAQL